MKSLKRKIFVLAVSCLAMACYALAQGISLGVSEGVGDQPSEPAVATPSQSTEPAPPSPSVVIIPPAPATDKFEAFAEMPPVIPGTRSRFVSKYIGGKSSDVLVIPDTEIKAEDVAAITQDMQVMSRIFDKIFQGPRLIEGMFRDYGEFFGRGSRATQAIYLQGYGTLFLLEVDFPFSPPPKSTTKEEQPEDADSVWQQAKQEIFYPTTIQRTQPQEDKYDAEKVEELKSRLIKALKHAANIRNLKPDELIILTVIGKGRNYGGGYGGGMSGYGGGYDGGMSGYGRGDYGSSTDNGTSNRRYRSRYITTKSVPGGIGISAPTVLTIRAKKSDVDAFSKGDLDYDKFCEKVQILTCPYFGSKRGTATSSNNLGLLHIQMR